MRRNIEYKNIEDSIVFYILQKIKKITNSSIFYILYYRKVKRKEINELGNKRAHFCSENST